MPNAMKIPKNVINVKRVTQCAILPLSAPLLVASHTPNVLPVLANAFHVNQAKTKTALRSRPLVTKNVLRYKLHHVEPMVNAHHAQKALLIQDASQLPLVRLLASHTHHLQRTTTSAHGTPPSHNALLEMEPRARLSVSSNASQFHSESATSRTTLV
jgi:hypothetical protein